MKLLLATALLMSAQVFASVPISDEVEPQARQAAGAAAELVKLYGYRCDSVDFFMRSDWDGNYHLTCNGNRYSYILKDVGGRLVVEVR